MPTQPNEFKVSLRKYMKLLKRDKRIRSEDEK